MFVDGWHGKVKTDDSGLWSGERLVTQLEAKTK
jgi:hypothetical protein